MTRFLFALVLFLFFMPQVPASATIAKGVFAADSGEATVTVRRAAPIAKKDARSASDTLAFTYTFPVPAFEERDDGTATVRMNGVENFGGVGDPALPALPVRLAIPKGRTLASVECVGERESCAAGLVLTHVAKPVPTSSATTDGDDTERNEAVYGSDEPFPAQCFSEWSLANKRGVQFVDLLVYPVMYKGLSGEVLYSPEITVTLTLAPQGPVARSAAPASDAPRVRSQDDTDAVLFLLDNPEEVATYVPTDATGGVSAKRSSASTRAADYSPISYKQPTLPCKVDSDFPNGYQHVIITSEALLDAFEQLVTYRRGQGVSSTAVTVEQILNANYSGRDTQEKIRNFIRDAYNTWNTEYIVLGGDTGHVPARLLYGGYNYEKVSSVNYGWVYYDIPSDLYYQCLTDDFDADGDSVFGESNDKVDFYAEVAIGRVSADSATEVGNWFAKLKQYNVDVQDGKPYTKAMLSVGEDMGAKWRSSRYASVFLEQTRKGGTYDGYQTKGFADSKNFSTRDTLYESANYAWTAGELIEKINANKYAVLNHLGHGNYNINMKLYSSDVDSKVKNTSPMFIYSWACISGAFEKDCIAEHFTTSSKYGCFGGVWNSRYGWGGDGTDSTSHRLERYFWNAVFTASDSNDGMAGFANQISHEKNASKVGTLTNEKGLDYYRWVIYESNLFGDPIQQINGATLSGDEDGVSISKPTVSFSASGGDGTAEVTASASWTATASDSWIVLKTTSGSGNGTISYTVSANPGTTDREGSITVKSGTQTAAQRVTQSAVPAELSVSPPENNFENGANTGSFDVEANYSWTATASDGWITLGRTSGIGNGTVSYSVGANTGGARTGTITVKSGTLTAQHQVTQAAQPTLEISPETASVAATAASGSFSVTADSAWTVTKSGTATWITLKTTSGNGNGTVSFSLDKNTGAKRTGYIYVKSGSLTRTYALTQRCANTVTFSESTVYIPSEGGNGTLTATVLTDGASTATVPGSRTGYWISWTSSQTAVTDGTRYTYSWTADANTTGIAREEALTIVLNGMNYSCTFVQEPSAGSYRVTYRPGAYGTGAEISISKASGGILMLKGAIYTRTNYTQKGWATIDGGGKVYDLMGVYTENKSVVLYPYWEPVIEDEDYTITFAPGRYGTGDYQTATKYAGKALALPGALYTRDGYEQTGWSTDWSGTVRTYALGGSYTADAKATLYPYWEESADDETQYDIGFYTPGGWKQPMCLSETNLPFWTYAPRFVFGQGDGLILNYCVQNRSTSDVTLEDRYISIWDADSHRISSGIESCADTISSGKSMLFPNRNLSDWLSSLAPGNYRCEIWLDPYDKLKDPDRSDNRWDEWFAVQADGITFNEALDCSTLTFVKGSEEAVVFPQTSEGVSGGSCVQFGPQATNSFKAGLYTKVTGPGMLSFQWKAVSQDRGAYLGLYIDGNLTNSIWATQASVWEKATLSIDEGEHWVTWGFGTYSPSPSYLTAGWVDCVSWSGSAGTPEFTVDSNGTLTGVKLNGVTDLAIPSEVNGTTVCAIGAYVLTNTAITSVSIPETVSSIEKFAFYNNPCLAGVTIPGSVAYIHESAFNACTGLKSVVLEEGVQAIGNYAFYNCPSLTDIRIPASVTLIEQSPFGLCPNLRTIAVAPGNTIYSVRDTALVDVYNKLIQYPSGRPESEYTIPDGITAVGYDAFDTVTALKKVRIPADVTSLGRYAFWHCSNLAAVEFLGDAPTVGDYAFYGVATSCTAQVSPRSTGWGVSIPGSWQGLAIAYSQDLAAYQVCYAPGSNGSGASQMVTKPHGGSLKLSGALFTRTGYAQTGWSLADGGAMAYNLGGSYAVDADVILYPYWTANRYSVTYVLDDRTEGTPPLSEAAFDAAFRVPAPTREGYEFMGWMVTSGLDPATARYGTSASDLSCAIASDSQQCLNGATADVWFVNLTPAAGGSVTLTATWEEVDDGRRDVGFYTLSSYGWEAPMCLSSTNLAYLAYAPETEFRQFGDVYLNFCAVNWSRAGTAVLQSTRLTITDENGNVFDEGEPIQRKTIGTYTCVEIQNMALKHYLHGITPGRYQLTLELDPNQLLDDPNRSNNTTSLWFTVTAPTEAIPELPDGATAADVRAALAGSADGHLAENLGDATAYAAYRDWARRVKGPGGGTAGAAAVKASDKAWFSFAVDSPTLIEKTLAPEDVRIENFAVSSGGGKFDFTVGIAGVEIGDAAATERLMTVFGIESASKLVDGAFSAGDLMLNGAEPANGKVRLTATPPPPKTGDAAVSTASFMRVQVEQ